MPLCIADAGGRVGGGKEGAILREGVPFVGGGDVLGISAEAPGAEFKGEHFAPHSPGEVFLRNVLEDGGGI